MKKLIITLVLLTAFAVNAQKQGKSDLSSEQIATLKTKKMTLQYNLSDSQIDKIYALNLELIKAHRSKTKLTKEDRNKLSSDEKFQKQMARLDAQIATKKRFAAVLSEKQMEKFEKHQNKRGPKFKKRRMNRKQNKKRNRN
ncbi:MAG: hypothetical protein V3U80_02070 [Flavobacteriaceae bacterium]